jgi:hypothetical protein
MKSKWFKGVIALAIVWFMASPAHASDDDLRLAGREVQVVNKGKANNADDVFWFRLQVRDLCVAVGSGVGDSEPGPCSDWRFLGSKAASDPQLRLPDGMSAGAWSAVEVYAQLLLEDGAEASKLQMELVDGLWVAHLDSEQRAAVGRFPDAVLSVSEVRWGDPAVPGSGPALVVPGLDIGGARQLVLGAFDRDPGHRASTVPDEPDAVGVDETVGETGEPADLVTALLESEVLRYYRLLSAKPTEAELKSGFRAASEMVLADVAIEQISLAIDEAIRRHNSGVAVPFAVAVPRLVRALAKEDGPAEFSHSNPTPVVPDLPRMRRPGPRWEFAVGIPLLVHGIALAVPFGILATGIVGDLRPLGGLGSFLGFLVFTPMVVGLVMVVASGPFILAGAVKTEQDRARLQSQHPDFRHTRARRLQVEWGMRFASPY